MLALNRQMKAGQRRLGCWWRVSKWASFFD